jgi:hypothetical protein
MLLHQLRNALDYPLRQFFRWRRRGLQLRNEAKDNLYATLPLPQRTEARAAAERIAQRYDLSYLFAHSRRRNYCENLFYLELIEVALGHSDLRGSAASHDRSGLALNAADIGPSHWFYVQAVYALLRQWRAETPREVTLTGYEADAYRVYGDLYSRMDYALAHMHGLPGDKVRYLSQAFTRQPAAFDLVTMLFPFVFVRDHLGWGLPRSKFNPADLLADAWASARPGGALIIVNQGEEEHTAQRAMLAGQGIPIVAAYRHDSVLFKYDLPRFVLVATKTD